MSDETPAEPKPPSVQLTGWLCAVVRSQQLGVLADLRRPNAITRSHLTAAAFAPEEEYRKVFETTAFLFARYHAGATVPKSGYGNVGAALRKIGSGAGRGPDDPGAARLLDRLVASREIPWRHLQHAIERARACEVQPPSWAQLTEDLCQWKSRRRPETVPYTWARSFYTPTFIKNGPA